MSNYPHKDQDAKTGSNLRGEPLVAKRRAEIERRLKAQQRLAKDHHRETKAFFSKAELKQAAQIREKVIADFRKASIKVGGDAERVAELKAAARKKFERLLARELPAYKKLKTLQKTHMRAQDKLATTAAAAHLPSNISIDWGDVIVVGLDSGECFQPPYTTFDVQMVDFGEKVVEDQSFAKPGIGHLVNNFVYDDNQSTSLIAGAFGILPINSASSMVSCGVSFTTPSAGRLKVGALLRNFYNRIVVSVEDKFGFSSAKVSVSADFLVLVVRGTTVEVVTKQLFIARADSGGDDVHRVLTDIDTDNPFSVSVETATHLDANESVLVLAGSEVSVGSILDDMHCKANALLWWRLEKLCIEMAVDIIT